MEDFFLWWEQLFGLNYLNFRKAAYTPLELNEAANFQLHRIIKKTGVQKKSPRGKCGKDNPVLYLKVCPNNI